VTSGIITGSLRGSFYGVGFFVYPNSITLATC